MDLSPDEDHEAIREGVRAICRDFDADYWRRCDDDHEFPWAFHEAMAAGGWIGISMPEEFGGGGRGITEASIVVEEVAASGAAMNGCSAIHLSIFGMEPVRRHGSPELAQELLPRVADGTLQVCFGVTEPDAGSDTSSVTTRARRDGDDYVVDGAKVWTSKALESDVCLLLVRTTPRDEGVRPTDGLSLLVVDLDDPAVTITPIPKVGRNAVASCEVRYDGLRVPASRLVGDEGAGFGYLLDGLNPERILVAAEALGIGRAALARAVTYAGDRVVFDRPIGQNQGVAFPLADSHARLRAAEQMVRLAAWRYDHGLSCGEEANIAKYLAAEAGFECADRAMQTHGGFGYASEYHVERLWREARMLKLAPVTQEMVLNFLATKVLGLPKSY